MNELKKSGRAKVIVRLRLTGLRALFWVFAVISAGLVLAGDRTSAGVLAIAAAVVLVSGLMQGRRKS